MMSKQTRKLLTLNIILFIFLLSIPFIAYYIFGGFLIDIIFKDEPISEDIISISGILTLGSFIALVFIGIISVYKIGQRLITTKLLRKFYYLFYITIFFLVPISVIQIIIIVDSSNTKLHETQRQMYKDSVQVVKINERLSQTHLCLDQALILDLDVNVKYKGDYVLYGYIDFDEGLPSEIARLETRTVNGIRTWPYCDDQQRDASGKCPSLLHLDPGQNRISVEFHGFAKRLIKLEKAGSFPLEMSARIIIHRERGFLERLFIKTGAFVKNDRISIEEYDVLYQSGDAYRTNHYDFRTILARCINDNVYGR